MDHYRHTAPQVRSLSVTETVPAESLNCGLTMREIWMQQVYSDAPAQGYSDQPQQTLAYGGSGIAGSKSFTQRDIYGTPSQDNYGSGSDFVSGVQQPPYSRSRPFNTAGQNAEYHNGQYGNTRSAYQDQGRVGGSGVSGTAQYYDQGAISLPSSKQQKEQPHTQANATYQPADAYLKHPAGGPSGALSRESSVASSDGSEESKLRKMLASVTAELGKQISAAQSSAHSSDPAGRAQWLQKLVLQMEAKQAVSESELHEITSKCANLQIKMQGAEEENDALREKLSLATRGVPPQAGSAPSEEQARELMILKRENQGYRNQIEDMSRRHDILERSVKHFELQQRTVVGEKNTLVLRIQGAEQRTDQLMKQKSMMDEELHKLRGQLAQTQQEMQAALQRQQQENQQAREQDAAKAREEIKSLLERSDQQTEQFEKQRALMVQQRDGVQAGYEVELNDALTKLATASSKCEELEAALTSLTSNHAEEIERRETTFVQGINELKEKHAVDVAHREEMFVANLKELEDTHAGDLQRRENAYVAGIQKVEDKASEIEQARALLAQSLEDSTIALERKTAEALGLENACTLREDRWALCSRKAVAKGGLFRALLNWKALSFHTKVSLQILHVAFSTTRSRWHRRALSVMFQGWKSLAREGVALSDYVHVGANARALRSAFCEWAMIARAAVRDAQSAAVEKLHSETMKLQKNESLAETERLLQTKDAEARQFLEQVKAQHQQELAEKSHAHMEEMIKLNHLLEARGSEMAAEVAELKKQSDQMEAQLREEIVNENVRLNQMIQEAQDENSRQQREWRKKQLEKEREHAAQIEMLERLKVECEEELHVKLKEKERDLERKLEETRCDFDSRVDELRKKGYAREKEFMKKQEASRSEYLRAQEDFQQEMLAKEQECRMQMQAKETEMNRHLESMLQGKMNAHVQELQAKLVEKDSQIESFRTEVSQSAQRSAQQQASVEQLKVEMEVLATHRDELSKRLMEANGELRASQEARQELKQQVAITSSEYNRRVTRLEESLGQKESELALLGKEKDDLVGELGQASQTLLKRGDDFAGSVRLLQRRLEQSDAESKAFQEQLDQAQKTNARMSSELGEAKAMLQIESARSRAAGASSDDLQEKLARAQMELKQKEQQHASELQKAQQTTQHSSETQILRERQHELLSPVSRGGGLSSREIMELQNRVDELEAYVQEVQPRIDSTQRENETLTAEMDKVLNENAAMRSELDDLKDSLDNTSQHRLGHQQHAMSMSHYVLQQHNRLAGGYRQSVGCSDERPRGTSGVHGLRLLRLAFNSWNTLTKDMRSMGRNPSFSCLNYFCDTDGYLASWMPVGRIRKNELEVKAEKVGSGTFADVFRAELKIPCALKRMKGPLHQKELMEFVREGEMMRNVNHPSIVKLLGVSTDSGQYSLVVEYVAGTNLFDYLHKQQKTISFGKQLGISVQMSDAMAYVHECNLIHRDLKPQNVIYQDKTGVAKLCDFGLARVMPNNVRELNPSDLGTGGTPAYQGPEVLKRQAVSRKLDLYGFAIMLWEMYTSRLPWSDCNLEQMTTRVAVQNERPVLPKDMPREYSEIINRCWQRDPQLRPDFVDILPVLRELHEAMSPGPKMSSAGSVGSVHSGSSGSGSTSSTVISHAQYSHSLKAQGYQNRDPNMPQRGVASVLHSQRSQAPAGPGSAMSVFGPF